MAKRANTLHIVLPPLSRFDGDTAWRRWLARADRLAAAERGYLPAIAALFQCAGGGLPVAALLRQQLAGDAENGVWLCVDPAHMRPDMTGARMLACGNLDLTRDEAEALARPLRPLFGDSGGLLEITTPSRWHMRLLSAAQPPAFASPEQVLGDSLIGYLPEGPDGRTWRRLFTAAQVILHQHPVNAARRARGQLPANSLWLWAAGALPIWVKSPLVHVVADAPLLLALAARAGISAQPPTDFDPAHAAAGNTLLDLSEATDIAACRQAVQSGLRGGRYRVLDIAFVSGERYRLRRHHRWRLWRARPKGP